MIQAYKDFNKLQEIDWFTSPVIATETINRAMGQSQWNTPEKKTHFN